MHHETSFLCYTVIAHNTTHCKFRAGDVCGKTVEYISFTACAVNLTSNNRRLGPITERAVGVSNAEPNIFFFPALESHLVIFDGNVKLT